MIKTLPTLENLAKISDYIKNNIEIPIENLLITISVSPEEHIVFDEKLHKEWGEGEFEHTKVIDLNIGDIKFKIISDENIKVDTEFKVDEHGKIYI